METLFPTMPWPPDLQGRRRVLLKVELAAAGFTPQECVRASSAATYVRMDVLTAALVAADGLPDSRDGDAVYARRLGVYLPWLRREPGLGKCMVMAYADASTRAEEVEAGRQYLPPVD